MTDRSTVLSPTGLSAWVYDPQHNRIDLISSTGHLQGWSLDQQAFTLDASIGGTPNTLDISADGKILIAGNNGTTLVGGVTNAGFERVNLTTLGVDQILVPLTSASQKGLLQLEIGQDGDAYYDRQSGFVLTPDLQAFDITAATPTTAAAVNLTSAAIGSYIERSADHRYLLIENGNAGGGPMMLYDTTTHNVLATSSLAGGDFLVGRGDISISANLIVGVTYNTLEVLNFNLGLVKNLSSFQTAGAVAGAAFSNDGHQLFLWQGQAQKVLVIDTQTWTQVGSFASTLSASLPSPLSSATGGEMHVAGDFLVLDNGAGKLELDDLAAKEQLTLTGGASDDTLWGGIGGDSLSGGGGQDVLVGGRGADTMSGGSGDDIFNFAPGDSPAVAGQGDVITDWQAGDHMRFGLAAATSASYAEATAGSFAAALTTANGLIAGGTVDYVAVQVGADVVVFADSHNDNGTADDAVTLSGKTLADVGPENFLGLAVAGGGSGGGASGFSLPPMPTPPSGASQMSVNGNMDASNLSDLLPAVVNDASDTHIGANGPTSLLFGLTLNINGTGFTYGATALGPGTQLVGGLATGFSFEDVTADGHQVMLLQAQGVQIPAGQLETWLASNATTTTYQAIFAGNDVVKGGPNADLIHSYDGNDLLYGAGGGDTLYGGNGDDIIYAVAPPNAPQFTTIGSTTASTYLRGEEGDDYIIGGAGFDDANGNMGNDTISTGAGDDFSVGGKDNDLLFGDDGNDIVWGNLGNDTCDGGNGNDQVRGGQGDDMVYGGAGNDFISGDRGNDTEVGGAGADNFHGSQDAGIDKVLDFNVGEGDRVELDPGTTYTVSQVGADTIIDMGASGGAPNQMILVGVQMSTLHADSIFLG